MTVSVSDDDTTHPFNIGKAAGKFFVGRDREVAIFLEILADLSAGSPRHIFVAGLPGTGKTSFLERCAALASQRQFLAPQLDLNPGLMRDQLLSILRAPLEELLERRSGEDGTVSAFLEEFYDGGKARNLRQPRHPVPESNHLRHDFNKIAGLAKESYGYNGIVICVDEAQYIEPAALPVLKNGLMRCRGVSVVLGTQLITASPNREEATRAKLFELASKDQGTTRMFSKLIAMGPFQDDDEAGHCIRRRLQGRPISFSDEVIRDICRVTRRVPRLLVEFSSDTYDIAKRSKVKVATPAVLAEAFRERYGASLSAVSAVVDELSPDAHRVLRALLRAQGPTTVTAIAESIDREAAGQSGGNAARPALSTVERWVAAELERISNMAHWCHPVEGSFELADPVVAYGLNLLLNTGP